MLEVPRVLEDPAFRGALLEQVDDPQLRAVWRTFFEPLDRRFLLEIINPVQTKTYELATNRLARAILGQSRSTVDPTAWVRQGALVVIDVAKERVGADIAALLGGALVNLVALAVGRQASLPPSQRRHVALLVDEFAALPAADYAALLAELGKYGASLVLATQTLGALGALDRDAQLRARVFGTIDHLFAFNCSAEDTRTLAPELGGHLEPADLVELGDYQCYVRLSHAGERLPPFHLRLDPPLPGDPVLRDLLGAYSAGLYGRDVGAVAADRAALLDRLAELGRTRLQAQGGIAADDPGKGALPDTHTHGRSTKRNQGRPTRGRARGAHLPSQLVLPDQDAPPGSCATAEAEPQEASG